ncbi:MAG: hypothetical protein ACP5J4_18305 [Anaerolineae bacterium]
MNANSLPDYKRRPLETRREQLVEEYESIMNQLGQAMASADKLRLNRQAQAREAEIAEIDAQLNGEPMQGIISTTEDRSESEPPVSEDYVPNLPPYCKIIDRDRERDAILKFSKVRAKDNRSFVMICGMPEIGKTCLASHLFNRYRTNSVWVSPPADFEDCEAYLTNVTKAVFAGQDKPTMVLNHELHEKDIWLFLDGVDAFVDADKFIGFLRRLSPDDKGKVVLTSTRPTKLRSEFRVELSLLSRDDAITLFVESWRPDQLKLSSAQLADVKQICGKSLLDGHPASIERIGANKGLIRESDLSLLVTRLKRDIQQMGKEKAVLSANISLESRTKQARSLLRRIALLPRKFDKNTVAYISQVSPTPDWDWEEAFGELIASRLIQVTQQPNDSSTYRVHNVVRTIARREAQTLQEFKQLQRKVGEMLIQSEQTSEWIAGLLSLFQAERWDKVISAFRERYGDCFWGEHLFAGDTTLDMLKARACYAIAYTFDQIGNANLAVDYAQQGIVLLINVPSEDTAAYSAIQLRLDAVLARNLLALHKYKEGQVKIKETAEVVKDLPVDQYQALQWEVGQIHLLEGIYYHYLVGDDTEAERVSRAAAEIYKNIGDAGQHLRALSNLSTALAGQGCLRESADVNREILQLLGKDRDFPTLSSNVVESLTGSETANLVDTLTKLGEFGEAQQHAYWGLPYCEEHGLGQSHAALLVNTGALEIELGEHGKARESLEEALALSRDLGYTAYEEQIYTYLAAVDLKQGNPERAQRDIKRALESEDSYNQAEAYRVAGEIYRAKGNYTLAKQNLMSSKQISQDNDYAYFKARASLELARLHQSAHEFGDMETNLLEAEGYFSQINAPYYLDLIAGLRQQMQ